MSYVQTTRGSQNINTDQRKPDVSDKIWMLDPEYAKLAFFARKLKKVVTTDAEYRHFEKRSPSKYDAVNYATNYTSGATVIAVDDGTKFRAGDVIQDVSTNEQMKVTSVSTNDLTVSRGWGGVAATTVTDNDVIVILGNANAEGAGVRNRLTSISSKVVNYTQIFREPFDTTNTLNSTELLAEKSDIVGLRKEHLDIHMTDMERTGFFGQAKEDVSGAQPIRATGGLRSHISTNVVTEAQLTEAEFDSWLSDLFSYGGDKKMGFMSPMIAGGINKWAKAKLVMYPKDKTYGISITNYVALGGSLDFVQENLFKENTVWNGYGFGVDMELISYRYLGGNGISRDTKLLKDRQAAGVDATMEEYLTEAGYQFKLENRHGYIKGVTSIG